MSRISFWVAAMVIIALGQGASGEAGTPASAATRQGAPTLVELGARNCIPCQLMAPIVEELRRDFQGKMRVEFIDVSDKANLAAAGRFGIRLIPTQVFLDAEGKELWRHEGFISRFGILDKLRELGYVFATDAPQPALSRLEPAPPAAGGRDGLCHLCDGPIDPHAQVRIRTDKGEVRLCSPHCYFILYSCLLEDKSGLEQKVTVTDYESCEPVALSAAFFVYGVEAKTGRPWIRAFSGAAKAEKHRQSAGGSLIQYDALQRKELATRCGFCDRAVYPEDAAGVAVGGLHTFGCCSHCALGVAARTGADIQVDQPDRLTGQMVTVKTMGGYVVSVTPKTAVAWLGLRKQPDGSFASAGCFHQGFFASPENLKKWLDQDPSAVGKMISIDQALADKMKLSAEQIAKACKIGQCTPK